MPPARPGRVWTPGRSSMSLITWAASRRGLDMYQASCWHWEVTPRQGCTVSGKKWMLSLSSCPKGKPVVRECNATANTVCSETDPSKNICFSFQSLTVFLFRWKSFDTNLTIWFFHVFYECMLLTQISGFHSDRFLHALGTLDHFLPYGPLCPHFLYQSF